MPVHDSMTSRRELLGRLGLGTLGLGLTGTPRVWAETAEETPAGVLSYRNARLVMPDQQVMDGGIRIEDGQIVEVGPAVRTGEDLAGAWISPGFVDAGCTVGLIEVGLESETREDKVKGKAVTPDARVWDGYNPASSVIPVTRVEGVTHVLVHPSGGSLVSGQAALFRTVGERVSDARVAIPPLLCVNMGRAGIGGDGPSSRMEVAMRLREILDEVETSEEPSSSWKRRRKSSGHREEKGQDETGTAEERIWKKVRKGETRVLLKVERADDILRALELAENYELNAILIGAAEGHRVASDIAAAGVPVFLGPLTVQPSSFEHLEARYDNAALLHQAGVPLAFRTGSAHSSRGLRVSAGVAVAHGLPWEAAMDALSPGAWRALGAAEQGQLHPGAQANLVITAGDPLQARVPVERVVIDGVERSMMTRQRRLFEHYQTLGDRVR